MNSLMKCDCNYDIIKKDDYNDYNLIQLVNKISINDYHEYDNIIIKNNTINKEQYIEVLK